MARRVRSGGTFALALLAGGLLAHPAAAADPELSLTDAVQQALESNLDLLARRRALRADRQEIELARAALLPQVDLGARAQTLDEERSDQARGNNKQRSVLVAAGLDQVLYDERSWAGFDIEKHAYEQKRRQLQSFRLGVVQDAADAFLQLEAARAKLGIQGRNREVTRRNLQTSRARIAAGWSSEYEVLRWQSQLAADDAAVRADEVLVLQSLLELNRVRNLPPEAPAEPLRTTIEEYGFAYARDEISEAILTPENDRLMRDFFVRTGLARSPDLGALDAAIAAAERQLTASQRDFWVPSLSVAAGVDHLANRGSSDFNATEWGAKGVLTFPLVRGGAKFAQLRQSREDLASLRIDRAATAQTLERAIRSALGQASGSHENLSFADRQVAAARRNYELVDASYVLGVASILDLLDAQAELLTADLNVVDALYGFLQDLLAAERQISFYAFLEAPAEVEALLDQLESELGLRP